MAVLRIFGRNDTTANPTDAGPLNVYCSHEEIKHKKGTWNSDFLDFMTKTGAAS